MAEQRLIDADALDAALESAQKTLETHWEKQWKMNKGQVKGLAWARAILMEAKSADVDAMIPRWISVEERLPDETDLNDQLVYCHDPINGHRWIQLAHILHDTSDDVRIWMDSEGYTVNTVTHWMELPEPPEEVQTDG